LQGYGLTETSGWATLMDFDSFSVGHVGRPLPGVHIKLVDWDEGEYTNEDKPNPRGEVVIGGVNVSAGYYKNDLLTKECFKEEKNMRWFYSGGIVKNMIIPII
jgi:long-chain acyl-CoA synthetase